MYSVNFYGAKDIMKQTVIVDLYSKGYAWLNAVALCSYKKDN